MFVEDVKQPNATYNCLGFQIGREILLPTEIINVEI